LNLDMGITSISLGIASPWSIMALALRRQGIMVSDHGQHPRLCTPHHTKGRQPACCAGEAGSWGAWGGRPHGSVWYCVGGAMGEPHLSACPRLRRMATSWGWPYTRFQRGRTTRRQRRFRYLPGHPGQPHQTHLGHRSCTKHQPPFRSQPGCLSSEPPVAQRHRAALRRSRWMTACLVRRSARRALRSLNTCRGRLLSSQVRVHSDSRCLSISRGLCMTTNPKLSRDR
jgi:hypothetical protein